MQAQAFGVELETGEIENCGQMMHTPSAVVASDAEYLPA